MSHITKFKPNELNVTPHIGIELEFDTDEPLRDVRDYFKYEILKEGLSHCARVDYEVIAANEMNGAKFGWELSLLTTETRYYNELQRMLDVLSKRVIYLDERCGFHLHIDCRRRNRIDVYHSLVKYQDHLFSLAADVRKEGEYCVPNNVDKEPHNKNAIYPSDKYDTVEVRIFESTFDIKKLDFYIKSVLGIVNFNNKLETSSDNKRR